MIILMISITKLLADRNHPGHKLLLRHQIYIPPSENL